MYDDPPTATAPRQQDQKQQKSAPMTVNLPPSQGDPVDAEEAIKPNKSAYVPKEQTDVDPGSSLQEIIEKFFFVADELGEPVKVSRERNIVSLQYPDDSMVRVTFEHRGGRHGGISTTPLDDENAEQKNKAFGNAQKREHEAIEEVKKRKEVSIKGEKEQEVKAKGEAQHKEEEERKKQQDQHKLKDDPKQDPRYQQQSPQQPRPQQPQRPPQQQPPSQPQQTPPPQQRK
jgi:hypothetical protein